MRTRGRNDMYSAKQCEFCTHKSRFSPVYMVQHLFKQHRFERGFSYVFRLAMDRNGNA